VTCIYGLKGITVRASIYSLLLSQHIIHFS